MSCDYRDKNCEGLGRYVNGRWICNKHLPGGDELQALRDEVARLKEQLKSAQADTWQQAARFHSDKDGNPCEYCLYQAAALTPQAGKGGGE